MDLGAHISLFKKVIGTNGEIAEVDSINLFGFTPKDSFFEWGENFVQDYPNCTFGKLEEQLCKQFKIVKNDEEVHMQ
jgi:hypothetical protein